MKRGRRSEEQFLQLRGRIWWFNRRVPAEYQKYDTSGRVRISLRTDSRKRACMLRDSVVKIYYAYWEQLRIEHSMRMDAKTALKELLTKLLKS